MAKVVFVNRFFFPDQSSTSQLLSDLAFALAADGHDIHIVASRRVIVGAPVDTMAEEETIRGVAVHRIGATGGRAPNLLRRVMDYLSFYALAAGHLRRHATRDAIVVLETDPPLLSVWAWAALAGKRVRIVNWLQDVYPEIAIRFDVPVIRGVVGRWLTSLRDRSLRDAAANVALGTRMKDLLVGRGADASTMRVIQNWVNDDAISPVAHTDNALRREWGFGDELVIGYSGNLGRVHEYDTLINAAERLRGRNDLRFLFIGDGFHYARLREEWERRGLGDLGVFKPYQPKEALSNSLGASDVHWLSLLPEYEGLSVPSKFFGIAAAARGTISVTDRDGEIARIVKAHDCGCVVEPGDAAGLAAAIEKLLADRALAIAWGRNARALLEDRYSRAHAIQRWRDLIGGLAPA